MKSWPFWLMATVIAVPRIAHATAAELYNPSWAGENSWTNNNLFNQPLGSSAYLEDSQVPWWQGRVAQPIQDYSADLLPTGAVRLDTALDVEMTMHRTLPGWTVQRSPSGINYVYGFTPGSSSQNAQTARSGQNAYFDFGAHPFQNWSADIGAELVSNNDQRYWFPVNDENRMQTSNTHAEIVRGEIKYDNKTFMLRGFEAVPEFGWVNQNDLFELLPTAANVEYYRRYEGADIPRGGEMRIKTESAGTLDVIGGSELQMRYGSSVYARYDLPTFRNWENSFIYRNEQIPFTLESNERRWTLSYNSSYPFSDRLTGHFGLLYQPFRLNEPYQDVNSDGDSVSNHTTGRADALGGTARVEGHPTLLVDGAGLGFTYLGPDAGNKEQVDADVSKNLSTAWTLSGSYIYRQPVMGPVPLIFEGTQSNPGALVAEPRGPDDPFWVQWDNRKAHIASLTLVFDPTPTTPFFKYQKNILDEYNLNPDEDSTWTGAVQYRVTDYLTNTDRLYYWDENGNIFYDPTFHNGALGTAYPFSSATGLIRWTHDRWRVTGAFSGGQALAGSAQAYTAATNFYKPSTDYFSGKLTVDNGTVKTFVYYGQDVYGPLDYFDQLGWTYHRVYEVGVSYTFLKAFEAGVRYTGTRMTDQFIGSNVGAFNEYNAFLTYHFSLQHNFANNLAAIGKPLPQSFPESSLKASASQFTPDGSGPVRTISLTPHAGADAGILSFHLAIRNDRGDAVREWKGDGVLPGVFEWEGLGPDGKPLPPGTYRATLSIVDLYGNEVTSAPQPIEIMSAPPVQAPAPAKSYQVTTTDEGLKVTLSSLILFDVNKATLKDSSKEGLSQVFELLRAYPTNKLRISGHTDSTGRTAHNQTLSEERARSVANELIQRGIAPSRIQTIGNGSAHPVASNESEEGRQQNRRVEIDILK